MIPFVVLMWKNFLVRKRRYLVSLIELITPFFLSMVFVFINIPKMCRMFDKHYTDYRKISMENVPRIMYAPENNATKMLMDEVTETLNIPRFPGLPENYDDLWSSSLNKNPKILRALEKVYAVIVFENLNSNETLPDKLTYTVRLKGEPPSNESLRSIVWRNLYGPAELDESFLRLQWAINSKFIKMKSNSSNEIQNITMRQFYRWHRPELENCHMVRYLILHAIVFFAPLLSFVLAITRLNEDRCNGTEALLEVAGIPWFIIDITKFLDSLLPCFIFCVTAAFYLPLKSNGLIIFMCLFFHCVSMIALAFVCSNITICGPNVVSTALFIYVGFFLLDLAVWPADYNPINIVLKGLLPHMPSFWFMYQLIPYEFQDFFEEYDGMDFNTWGQVIRFYPEHKGTASMKQSVEMLLTQIAVFFLLSLFLRSIRPKKYGKALAWNFPFQKDFWVKRVGHMPSAANNHHPAYDRYFEDPPTDLDVTVEVVNVKKNFFSRFTSVAALSDVSLRVYRGEITVIVGHNGSGKTTLLSIIAGIQQQSSGKVFFDGLITTMSKMKGKVAFCPQQSILFPDLTVQEHLMFYSKIAGDKEEGAEKTTERVMTQMNLNAEEASIPAKLSYGLQRRLQIGCTLCSQASLLLLDDPTSEIDIEARKDLYQILSTLRGKRTIIFTTNFLDEADMVADRVAALQRGVLCCYATPQFLKKAIDSGSRVKVASFKPTDADLITRTIRGAAPNVTLSENVMGSLVYNVPPGSNMAVVLDTLESNKEAMDIESLGVGPVLLEETLMNVCTDDETDTSEEQEKVLKHFDEIDHNQGWPLIHIQTRELLKRQLDYTYSRLLAFISLHFLAPAFVTMLLFIFIKHIAAPWDWGKYEIGFNMFSELNKPSATYMLNGYDFNKTQHIVNKMKEFFPQLQLRESEIEHVKNCDCTKCIKYGEKSKNIFDIYVDAQNAKLKYDRSMKHSAIVGLNVLSNIIAAQHLPQQGDKAITMRVGYERDTWSHARDEINIRIFAALIIFIVLITVIDDVGLPCRERTSCTRYYHIMAGCPPWLYWLVTLVYQVVCYALILIPSIIIITVIFDSDDTLKHFPAIRAYFVSLLVCGISFYTLAYFLSQCFNEETTKVILLEFMIIGSFSFLFLWASRWADLKMLAFYNFFSYTQVLNPALIYSITIRKLTLIAIHNQFCVFVRKIKVAHAFYDHRVPPESQISTSSCLDNSREYFGWFPYFTNTYPTLQWEIILMLIYTFVFTILVLLIEYQVFSKLWNKYEQQHTVTMPHRKYESKDVAAEKEYIKNTIMRSKETIKELVLVSRVWKIFFKFLNEPVFVLKDLNYSVKKGECFGFVGLNGAGKSSVFKAMTRQFLITKGVMYANGQFSHENSGLYLKGLGYCPHSLYLDTFRNGNKNMRMLMRLRGIDDDDVDTQCNAWQKILGLKRFPQMLVEEYSYGMQRRLSLGAALCRGERVLLLDQPLSGVDVAGRRQLWAVLERALAYGCSIIYASHNMEVVDHLCNQITFLDSGEVAAVGSPGDYKNSLAPGHSVVIKLRANSVFNSSGAARVQALKDFMYQEFNCYLMDDYLIQLHFIITKKLRFSILHEKLTSMVNEFKEIVEDYSAYDLNLEDALAQFLNDTRYDVEPNATW